MKSTSENRTSRNEVEPRSSKKEIPVAEPRSRPKRNTSQDSFYYDGVFESDEEDFYFKESSPPSRSSSSSSKSSKNPRKVVKKDEEVVSYPGSSERNFYSNVKKNFAENSSTGINSTPSILTPEYPCRCFNLLL